MVTEGEKRKIFNDFLNLNSFIIISVIVVVFVVIIINIIVIIIYKYVLNVTIWLVRWYYQMSQTVERSYSQVLLSWIILCEHSRYTDSTHLSKGTQFTS